ncbi:MAG: glycine cleavage system protein GcvH [Anaerolineaceae bacterium]|nr:glycine cleavage system protein GcvH [Anaerolineaceae bacterium]
MKTPENLKYGKTDEWVKMDGNIATIGISDYAQDQLSDIVYVEFNKDVDEAVKKDEVLSTIESVKTAGDVISPVSGKVLEVNEGLSDKPELLNDDPYEKGWVCKVEISIPAEYDALMSAKEYESYCAGRH